MTWKSGSAAAKSNGFWAQNHWEWHYFSTPRHSRQLLWIMALKPAFNMTQHYYRVAVDVDDDDDDDDDTEEVWDVDSVMVGEELMTAEWNVHSSLSLLDGQWGSQLSMLGLVTNYSVLASLHTSKTDMIDQSICRPHSNQINFARKHFDSSILQTLIKYFLWCPQCPLFPILVVSTSPRVRECTESPTVTTILSRYTRYRVINDPLLSLRYQHVSVIRVTLYHCQPLQSVIGIHCINLK